jgi:DNA sulfur modification protein DndE
MPPEHVRLSAEARQQLIQLKRRTGVKQWNVLCRWALCRSLAEPTAPPETRIPADSNVEMTWKVFAGQWGEVLWALVLDRCVTDGVPTDDNSANSYLRLHLHRGIGYLFGDQSIRDISALVRLTATG